MTLNAEHERIPRKLTHAVWLMRRLLRMKQAGVYGMNESIVYNAQYYAQELFRDWVNLNHWTHERTFNETWDETIRRMWNKIKVYHENKIEKVKYYVKEIRYLEAQLAIYATLPFSAPRHLYNQVEIALQHARIAFSEYWHTDATIQWTYEDILSMLETGQYVEITPLDRDDTREAGSGQADAAAGAETVDGVGQRAAGDPI